MTEFFTFVFKPLEKYSDQEMVVPFILLESLFYEKNICDVRHYLLKNFYGRNMRIIKADMTEEEFDSIKDTFPVALYFSVTKS